MVHSPAGALETESVDTERERVLTSRRRQQQRFNDTQPTHRAQRDAF